MLQQFTATNCKHHPCKRGTGADGKSDKGWSIYTNIPLHAGVHIFSSMVVQCSK